MMTVGLAGAMLAFGSYGSFTTRRLSLSLSLAASSTPLPHPSSGVHQWTVWSNKVGRFTERVRLQVSFALFDTAHRIERDLSRGT